MGRNGGGRCRSWGRGGGGCVRLRGRRCEDTKKVRLYSHSGRLLFLSFLAVVFLLAIRRNDVSYAFFRSFQRLSRAVVSRNENERKLRQTSRRLGRFRRGQVGRKGENIDERIATATKPLRHAGDNEYDQESTDSRTKELLLTVRSPLYTSRLHPCLT